MKKSLLSLVLAIGLYGFATGQSTDQNPRAYEAYRTYEAQVDSQHAASLGATVDKTYEAYDPMLIKEQRKEDRREFRRQLRLERARNRSFIQPYPYNYYRWGW